MAWASERELCFSQVWGHAVSETWQEECAMNQGTLQTAVLSAAELIDYLCPTSGAPYSVERYAEIFGLSLPSLPVRSLPIVTANQMLPAHPTPKRRNALSRMSCG